MPRSQGGSDAPGQKKKKKGPSPAHQNKFAFRHNPKSKKTEQILSSPNVNVCRRCHDKIEWRKQYRKYKPLTQPGTCNLCSLKNVKAAYHTICSKCSQHSAKAKELLEMWNRQQERPHTNQEQIDPGQSLPIPPDTITTDQHMVIDPQQENPDDDKQSLAITSTAPKEENGTQPPDRSVNYYRVCAVCVREPALKSFQQDEDALSRKSTELPILSLRERKRLERQRDRNENGNRETIDSPNSRSEQEKQKEHDPDDDGDMDFDSNSDEDDDDDDPFLKAVGGAQNLVTGEAYQQKVLASLQTKEC